MGNSDYSKFFQEGNKFFEEASKSKDKRKLFLAAKEKYEEALKCDPKSCQAHYNLGRCFEMLRDITNAKIEYQNAINCNNSYEPAKTELNRILENIRPNHIKSTTASYSANNQYDFFISYRQGPDNNLADALYKELNGKIFDESRNYPKISCYLDRENIPGGANWKESFKNGLQNASVIIMIVSESALKRMIILEEGKEDNLLYEWEMAINYKSDNIKEIFPIFTGDKIYSEDKFPLTKAKDAKQSVQEILKKLKDFQLTSGNANDIKNHLLPKLINKLKEFERI